MNSRTIAAIALAQVLPLNKGGLNQGRSLTDALNEAVSKHDDQEKGLVQAIAFGVCRHYTWLDQIANQLIRQAFKPKDKDLHSLLLVGLYQLYFMRIPDHAAISETVEGTRQLQKPWATKVINGMLRRAQREKNALKDKISESEAVQSSHPQWLVDLLKNAWPTQYQKILKANNEPAPMTLRVNQQKSTTSEYLQTLETNNIKAKQSELAQSAIILEKPQDVSNLPGFSEGLCSVQDEAAQLAAHILDPQPNDKVLDACAAPGGKTTHLLEKQPKIEQLVAIDNDPKRLHRIIENLERTNTTAEVLCEDLADYCERVALQGIYFDRILLDVPCSATGVIRRHPDIKWLRKRKDIAALSEIQLGLLTSCWRILAPGGTLLYATCSVLPQENERVINQFLKAEPSANEVIILLNHDENKRLQQTATLSGRQLLPEVGGHDGFYYAKLRKSPVEA